MTTIERFYWGHMLVSVAVLSIGFAGIGLGPCSALVIVAGLGWFTAQQRKMIGMEGLFLFGLVISAGVGLWNGAPQWLMLVAVVSALGAWDLYTFLLRLDRAAHVEFESGLGREHLRRLGLVELVGLLAGLVGITVHPRISFWWEALLVIIAIIGISIIIRRIRKEIG